MVPFRQGLNPLPLSLDVLLLLMEGYVTQQEFTDMAWQGIVIFSRCGEEENKHQIVETEHLMKCPLGAKEWPCSPHLFQSWGLIILSSS
ncbi:hypothetical protein D5086_008715 [Populus alba]|uniref:Uncharacterized protein n=1 Tax=Populus alba TaxID=43335 RepID=A0ACC4CIN6_POPAL